MNSNNDNLNTHQEHGVCLVENREYIEKLKLVNKKIHQSE